MTDPRTKINTNDPKVQRAIRKFVPLRDPIIAPIWDTLSWEEKLEVEQTLDPTYKPIQPNEGKKTKRRMR